MAKTNDPGMGFQHPPGYEIGGDACAPHHRAGVLPVTTQGEDAASEFQPPSGQILGDDLPMRMPEVIAGATENVMGGGKLADIRSDEGFIPLAPSPSVESTNPSIVNTDEPPLPRGILGRASGWER